MDKYIDEYQFSNDTGTTLLACDVDQTLKIIVVVLNDK
ncbi:hypothetical protein GPAL_3510 [Glaciecola pallidula DSM 14239 = ACAM 615]|jgi:hypothetical protein|uniref:Uncharacterized protein n=1 Tax=Brumicola pallidula DSM 14239 = ACAM 615 TaxID=1121922 RepID=K6ZNA4_9ALTE|nr:hypothetical protein GPAL_3510 [Glaciecola pallidula DSM 14239 = ACAM 615]